jgi:molecular chaperone DnaK (HSP70)
MIGDSAKAQMDSNFENTIPYVTRFLGLTSDCKSQLEEETKYISNTVEFGADNRLVFPVACRGEDLKLVPEQVYATFLKKLKKTFTHEDELIDVVVSVPAYYSVIERKAVIDA